MDLIRGASTGGQTKMYGLNYVWIDEKYEIEMSCWNDSRSRI